MRFIILLANILIKKLTINLKSSITNIMKLLIPLTPHLAYECLEKLGAENINSWPEVKFNQNEN